MSTRAARRLVLVLLGLYALGVTWPGIVPFNRIEPLMFGLPFVLFWIVAQVLVLGIAFALLNHAETRDERDAIPADEA